jgi:Outer membrane protein beta-barrel domain
MKMMTAKTTTTIRAALFTGLAAVTSLCAATPASAQAPSLNLKPRIYLAGGTALVTNPTLSKSMLDKGFSLMAAVGLPLNMGIEIVPKVQYHRFNVANDFLLSSSLTAIDPKLSILTFGADVKWGFLPPQAPTRPYFLVGGGSSTITRDALGGVGFGSVDETKIYLNVGAGLDVKIGPAFAFFVEGKYTFVNSSINSMGIFPLMAGIRIM